MLLKCQGSSGAGSSGAFQARACQPIPSSCPTQPQHWAPLWLCEYPGFVISLAETRTWACDGAGLWGAGARPCCGLAGAGAGIPVI